MKKLVVVILIALILTFSLYGCRQEEPAPPQNTNNDTEGNDIDNTEENQSITERIQVFYGDENNEKIISEEREITYKEDEDKYKIALEELIKGPNDEKLTANINRHTKVYGTIKENKNLIVDLSREFNQFPGSIAEIIGVGSVVNTMTQFKNVEKVKILVEGEELIGPSGEPRGFMETFPLNPQQEINKEVTLYFGGQNGVYVVPEKRTISTPDNINQQDYIKKVIEELIKGPETEGLHPTIPPEVKVLSVRIENNIAYVDFSEEMHTKHWGGAVGEAMTISSIANTLTEFDYINKVKMTVEGEPLTIEHTILEVPVGRNEDMIKK